MDLCPTNQSLSSPWYDKGLTPCFSDILTSSIVCGIAVLFGLCQVSFYSKYSTVHPDRRRRRQSSKLYLLHLSVHAALVITAIAALFTYVYHIQDGTCYSYQLITVSFKVLSWLIALGLILMEKKRQLPVIPTRGHGPTLLLIWAFGFASANLPFISWWGEQWWWRLDNDADRVRFGLWLLEYCLVLLAFTIGLIAAPALAVPANYTNMATDEERDLADPRQGSTWKGFFSKAKIIAPMVWPKGSTWLQICVVISALLLVGGRVCNLYVPIYYKLIVDDVPTRFCWDYILVWVALRFLQGGGSGASGFLSNIRTFLWIKVQQYATREAELKLFAHLHGLSLRWHLSKKTGEVLRVMDRGTTSINNILNYVVFSILPTIADIVIAIIYFTSAFDIYFGLIVFGTMALYLVATIIITEWRTKYRREMNLLDNVRNSRAVDSLINFETVKYYGNADFEVKTFDKTIVNYQVAEWKSIASLNLLSTAQNIIITLGLIGGTFLCALYIHDDDLIHHRKVTVGDFVLFCTYLVQLYGPLNMFGTYYRMIQAAFIDMENMFDLLDVKREINDVPHAAALEVKQGIVEFKDVHFHYDELKPVLKGVSFKVPAGETYALVGTSGAGKSSVIRLLFRFYDLTQGQITIDGQDISQVKQDSLRKAIGIVPQDTVLFNTDIKYNIAYGDPAASDEDINASAEAADIHQRILSFPDGYDTVVGERGLKLSGGEKQRVAIARTLLKNPHVILLDEATSALDTHTERNILRSFEEVCANRTTLVVAHRLSTIIHAHQILVLDEGVVKESGTHEELLSKGGMYHSMWEDQQKKRETLTDSGSMGASSDTNPAPAWSPTASDSAH